MALLDFGDAPDVSAGTRAESPDAGIQVDYETRFEDGGPSHVLVSGLLLGTRIDGDSTAVPSVLANGDDLGIDDEDGVVFPDSSLVLTVGTQPTVTLQATNTTGTDATLSGWIDLNANGVFDNATERVQSVVPTGTTNGLFTQIFPVVPPGFSDTTYARFRLSTDPASANSTGSATNGEVEDYRVTIVPPSNGAAPLDYGDAPDAIAGTRAESPDAGVEVDYQTRFEDSGPSHVLVSGLLLGTRIDGESTAVPSVLANGDDLGTDDEDGVLFSKSDLVLTVGTQPTVTLRATNTTGSNATLSGWIDFNADGVFDNATERAQTIVQTGTNNGLSRLVFRSCLRGPQARPTRGSG